MIVKVEIDGDRAVITCSPTETDPIAPIEMAADRIRHRFREQKERMVGYFTAQQQPKKTLAPDGSTVSAEPDPNGVLELADRVADQGW